MSNDEIKLLEDLSARSYELHLTSISHPIGKNKVRESYEKVKEAFEALYTYWLREDYGR